MTGSREAILGRVRAALGQRSAVDPVERTYRITGSLSASARLDLLHERLVDYRALVRRCTESELDAVVAVALRDRGVARVVVPAGLRLTWPAGLDVWVDDGTPSAADLDSCDAVATASALAIADTGTIVLDGSADQGRRAISLIPDYHLCIVRAEQVVETVPEAIARLAPEPAMTWISGPSATSDIELDRVEGVHGPRTLEVILVGP